MGRESRDCPKVQGTGAGAVEAQQLTQGPDFILGIKRTPETGPGPSPH